MPVLKPYFFKLNFKTKTKKTQTCILCVCVCMCAGTRTPEENQRELVLSQGGSGKLRVSGRPKTLGAGPSCWPTFQDFQRCFAVSSECVLFIRKQFSVSNSYRCMFISCVSVYMPMYGVCTDMWKPEDHSGFYSQEGCLPPRRQGLLS